MRALVIVAVLLATESDPALQLKRSMAHSPSVAEARDILVQLQRAIQDDDYRRVAGLIRFPLGVKKGKLAPTYVPSVKVFMRTHALVLTTRVRNAILAQNPASLTSKDGLIQIGGGVAAIGLRCESAERASCSTGVLWVSIINDPSVP